MTFVKQNVFQDLIKEKIDNKVQKLTHQFNSLDLKNKSSQNDQLKEDLLK